MERRREGERERGREGRIRKCEKCEKRNTMRRWASWEKRMEADMGHRQMVDDGRKMVEGRQWEVDGERERWWERDGGRETVREGRR